MPPATELDDIDTSLINSPRRGISPDLTDDDVKTLKNGLEQAMHLATNSSIPAKPIAENAPRHGGSTRNKTKNGSSGSTMLSDNLNPKLVQLAEFASWVGNELKLPFYEKMPDSEPDSHYLERGLRALAEGDKRMGVRQDGTPLYRSLRDSSVGGSSRDVVFDGYFRDPPRDERTVDPSLLSDDLGGGGGGGGMSSGVVQASARKGKKRARDVSHGNTSISSFRHENPRADVSSL